jgi:hypothetical protein
MGALGEVLEALHDAPRARSLWGRARTGQDHEKLRAAFERLRLGQGGHTSVAMLSVGTGAVLPTGFVDSPAEFWCADGNWRVDQHEGSTVGAASRVFRFHPGVGGVVSSDDEMPSEKFAALAMYLAPASWLGSFRFQVLEETARESRSCWHVAAEPTSWHRSMLMVGAGAGPGALSLQLWIDQATGIVLRCEGRHDEDLVSRFVVDAIVVDDPIDPEVFEFLTPDGSPIRTQGERMLEHLRDRGVDVSDIDPADSDAVQNAMQAHFFALNDPTDVEQLASQHTPTGPPPDDQEQALLDVTAAFQGMVDLSDDASALVNVEGGENLGSCATEVRRRFPQQTASGAIQVDKIKFLNATEAVVWFHSAFLPTREGRAVIARGRWQVSRATYRGLIAMAGVTCPPPPDPT